MPLDLHLGSIGKNKIGQIDREKSLGHIHPNNPILSVRFRQLISIGLHKFGTFPFVCGGGGTVAGCPRLGSTLCWCQSTPYASFNSIIIFSIKRGQARHVVSK